MYPDWPQSVDDLVPLPHCVGPKLKPFAFPGDGLKQNIEFLEYIGEGSHAHVFKIKVSDQIYALKLVSGLLTSASGQKLIRFEVLLPFGLGLA